MKKIGIVIILLWIVVVLVGCQNTAVVEQPMAESSQAQEANEVTTAAGNDTAIKGKSETEGFLKGYKAIEVTGEDLEGNPFTLTEQVGKVVVLNFWASWCPPCDAEIPDFNKAHEAIQGTDAMIIGINLIESDSLKDVEAKIAEHDIVYPILLDKGNTIASAYKVRNIPTTIIVNPKGIIHDVYVGALSEEHLLQLIEEAKK